MPQSGHPAPAGVDLLHNPHLNRGSAFPLAARAVAEQVTEANLTIGLIYPPTSNILDASLHTAGRIAEYIFDHGLASVPRPDDIDAHVRARAYKPIYPAQI